MSTKKKTEKKTAIDAQRTSADYVIDPEDLYVETNPAHPLYDPRWMLEVTPEQIETWQLAGQTKDIVCRKNGDRIEVVDGLQTLKTALSVNRNRRLHNLEPIQVRITLKALPSNAAVMLFREISNRRRVSLPSMIARQAATMLAQGVPRASVLLAVEGIGGQRALDRFLALHELSPEVKRAVDEGALSAGAAVARFKDMRLDQQPRALAEYLSEGGTQAPRPPGERTRPFPAIDVVRRVHAKAPTGLLVDAGVLLGWVAGKVTRDELVAAHPSLASAFSE